MAQFALSLSTPTQFRTATSLPFFASLTCALFSNEAIEITSPNIKGTYYRIVILFQNLESLQRIYTNQEPRVGWDRISALLSTERLQTHVFTTITKIFFVFVRSPI